MIYRDWHLYVSCQFYDSFIIPKFNDERILSSAESAEEALKGLGDGQ